MSADETPGRQWRVRGHAEDRPPDHPARPTLALRTGPIEEFTRGLAGAAEALSMEGPLLLVIPYSTVNGGARDIRPFAFRRSAINP